MIHNRMKRDFVIKQRVEIKNSFEIIPPKPAILLLRVSTSKQGDSRLGLENQRKETISFFEQKGYNVINEYLEVESGTYKRKFKFDRNMSIGAILDHRPHTRMAINECKEKGATLICLNVERLGRIRLLIDYLTQSDIDFKTVDEYNQSILEISLRASFAEEEARKISERTKRALDIKRQMNPDWKIGFAGMTETKKKNIMTKGCKTRGRNLKRIAATNPNNITALKYMMKHRHYIEEPYNKNKHILTFKNIVDNLNDMGIKTSTGSKWSTGSLYVLWKHRKEYLNINEKELANS